MRLSKEAIKRIKKQLVQLNQAIAEFTLVMAEYYVPDGVWGNVDPEPLKKHPPKEVCEHLLHGHKRLPTRMVYVDNTISFKNETLHVEGAKPGDLVEVITDPFSQAYAWQYPCADEEHKCTLASPAPPRSLCHIDHVTHTERR